MKSILKLKKQNEFISFSEFLDSVDADKVRKYIKCKKNQFNEIDITISNQNKKNSDSDNPTQRLNQYEDKIDLGIETLIAHSVVLDLEYHRGKGEFNSHSLRIFHDIGNYARANNFYDEVLKITRSEALEDLIKHFSNKCGSEERIERLNAKIDKIKYAQGNLYEKYVSKFQDEFKKVQSDCSREKIDFQKIRENINHQELQGYMMNNYGCLLIELFKFNRLELSPNQKYSYPAYASIVITSYVILKECCITEDTEKLRSEAKGSIRFIRRHFNQIFKNEKRAVKTYYRNLMKGKTAINDIDENRSYYILKEIQNKCLKNQHD